MIADEDIAAVDWQLPGLRIKAEPVPDVAAKFDLTLGFRQDHDADGAPAGISASFEYAEDLFDQATVQALAGRLTRLLRQAAARSRPPRQPARRADRRANGAGCCATGTTPPGRCRRPPCRSCSRSRPPAPRTPPPSSPPAPS